MARKRSKKALYEVMSKARKKPGFGRTLEKMLPEKPVLKEEEEAVEVVVKKKSETDVETSKTAAKWWKKPRVVQFNVGRIEFSMPYQLGVVLILGSILLILASFRLGQISDFFSKKTTEPSMNAANESVQENRIEKQEVPDTMEPPAPVEEESALLKIEEPKEEPKPAEPVVPKSTGNNVIVLVQFGSQEDLRPVRAHFAEHGIETEIVLEKGSYFLQTKNRYNNPGTPGTDGHEALQEIIKAGAKYKGKAPPNYETFAPNFFSDAYGKKVK